MEKLIRKSKISDKKSIFSDYIRYPEKYDTYMKNAVYSVMLNSNSTKANMFREKISNNFARNLEVESFFSLDYLGQSFRLSGPFGAFIRILTLPIEIFDLLYGMLYKK